MKVSTALISVFDKTGVVDFARELHGLGVKILSSGGTARKLKEAGIGVTEVSEHTGSPEIMDGRVKTLHPKVHGGILVVRDNEDHMRQAKEQDITPIDLVCVNLYPFLKVIEKPDVTLDEAIENIDIGGPTMVRSAAKNHKYVTIVTDPDDYGRVLEALKKEEGTTDALRGELAAKAFAHTAHYDGAITGYLTGGANLSLSFRKVRDLRYGENPHQKGAFYRAADAKGSSVATARFLSGKELSYNNLLDLESAFELVREFTQPACVVVKHNNPCGTSVAETPAEAFVRARDGDPVSAYGGIVALNRRVDLATAEKIATKENFVEAIIAPGYEKDALKKLRKKMKWGKTLRILETEGDFAGAAPDVYRGIRNGLLVQGPDDAIVADVEAATGILTDELRDELLFAMTVCKHVRSNAIVIARDRRLVGVGAGQMSRLDSSHLAVRKAGERSKGAVAASDAFFPFPDALKTLTDAGVKAVIQPGGSIRDDEVTAAAREAGIVLVMTGMRHFRH